MFRSTLQAIPAITLLWSSTALADLVINIPDVPVFTIDDPITSDEDVFINALPTTELIINAPITAPNLTISQPASIILDLILVDGEVNISSGGNIVLDDVVNLPIIDATGGDIVPTGGGSISGGGISVSTGGNPSPQAPPPDGQISLGGSTGVDVVTTTLDLADSNGVELGSVTVTASSPITLNSVTVTDAGAGAGSSAVQSVETAEVPIAIVETSNGQLQIPIDAGSLAPLAADLGGGGHPAQSHRSNGFASKLFSCPQSEPDARFDEGSCAWAIAEGSRIEADAGAGDFDDTTFAFAFGAQTQLAPDVFMGAALGYEASDIATSSTQRDTARIRGGAALKYDDGAASLGLVIAGGYADTDTSRQLASGASVLGSTEGFNIEGRIRAAYGLTFGQIAVEPSLALSLLHTRENGYAETGAALAARRINSTDKTTFGVHPAFSIGTDFVAGPFNTRIRPELALGLDWYSDPDFTLTGTGATGRALFQTVSPDQLTATFGAGLTVFAADDVSLRFRYQGRFGENTIGHGGQVKLALGF